MGKLKKKFLIDAAMIAALILAMIYHVTGEDAHVVIGLVFAVITAAHVVVSRRAIRAAGPWSAARFFSALTTFWLAVWGGAAIWSGCAIVGLLPGDIATARVVHLASVHWTLVLAGAHTGMHLSPIVSIISSRLARAPRVALCVCSIVFALWGGLSFFRSEMPSYMVLSTLFAYFDYDASAPFEIARVAAVFAFFVLVGRCISLVFRAPKRDAAPRRFL